MGKERQGNRINKSMAYSVVFVLMDIDCESVHKSKEMIWILWTEHVIMWFARQMFQPGREDKNWTSFKMLH